MLGITGIIAALTVLGLSLFITRLATAALTLTGLSEEAARFQARSAFTGTGFTTNEAEQVVSHPVRRNIIMLLMITRSAGLVTIIISLVLSFGQNASGAEVGRRLILLAAGAAVLLLAARSRRFDRVVRRAMEHGLSRWTDLDTRDYQSLLRLSGDYRVTELAVEEEDWIAGQTLASCKLTGEGIMVLGVLREDGSYVGAPHGATRIYAGDTLLLYGRRETLQNLSERRKDPEGNRKHAEAVEKQQEYLQDQERQESAREKEREAQRKAKQGD